MLQMGTETKKLQRVCHYLKFELKFFFLNMHNGFFLFRGIPSFGSDDVTNNTARSRYSLCPLPSASSDKVSDSAS